MKWPADKERDEDESFTWCILTEDNWNAETVLGWRFSASELKKRAMGERAAKRSRRREG